MQVQAVLQAQWQELFFTQFTSHETLHLIAKLRHALEHQRTVILVILIHGSDLITEALTMALRCTELQIQVYRIYTDQLSIRRLILPRSSAHSQRIRPLAQLLP